MVYSFTNLDVLRILMTRTQRKRGKASRIKIDQELFEQLKKAALKQRKRKNHKLNFNSIASRLTPAKRIQLNSNYDLKDTPLGVHLLEELKMMEDDHILDEDKKRMITRALKQVERRGEIGDFKSHRDRKQKFKRQKNYTGKNYFQILKEQSYGRWFCLCCCCCDDPYQSMVYLFDEQITGFADLEKEVMLRYEGDTLFEFLQGQDMSVYEQLRLGEQGLSNYGVKCIAQGNWNNVQIMDLGRNRISGKGIKYLTRLPSTNLMVLKLGYNMVGRQGMSHLSKARWISLEKVYLGDTEGVQWLCKGDFPYLNRIMLGKEGCRYYEALQLLLLSDVNNQKYTQFDEREWEQYTELWSGDQYFGYNSSYLYNGSGGRRRGQVEADDSCHLEVISNYQATSRRGSRNYQFPLFTRQQLVRLDKLFSLREFKISQQIQDNLVNFN